MQDGWKSGTLDDGMIFHAADTESARLSDESERNVVIPKRPVFLWRHGRRSTWGRRRRLWRSRRRRHVEKAVYSLLHLSPSLGS